MRLKLTLLFGLILILSGCGYRFVGSYSGLEGRIKSIYIANVKNFTDEPNLGVYFRDDLIQRFNLDSRLSVVGDPGSADSVLEAKIVSYSIKPSAYASSGLASLFKCSVVALVSLKSGSGSTIKNLRVTAYQNYRASDTVSATEIARKVICKQVLKDLANKVDEELFLNF